MLTVVLFAGSTGAGKTTVAQSVGRALQWPVVDKDTSKSTLLAGGVSEETAAPLAYDLMFAHASDLLAQGFSVILDSPASYAESVRNAEQVARDGRARLKVVLCTADKTLREARLRERAPRLSQPSVPNERPMDEAHRYAHLPEGALTIDTGQPADETLQAVVSYLQAP